MQHYKVDKRSENWHNNKVPQFDHLGERTPVVLRRTTISSFTYGSS